MGFGSALPLFELGKICCQLPSEPCFKLALPSVHSFFSFSYLFCLSFVHNIYLIFAYCEHLKLTTIFKLRQGASLNQFVCRSVCLSVCRLVCLQKNLTKKKPSIRWTSLRLSTCRD